MDALLLLDDFVVVPGCDKNSKTSLEGTWRGMQSKTLKYNNTII